MFIVIALYKQEALKLIDMFKEGGLLDK